MSNRKGNTNRKLEILNEINQIDRKLKKKGMDAKEEREKLISRRNTLRTKLKTKR